MAIYRFDELIKQAGVKPNEVESLGVQSSQQLQEPTKSFGQRIAGGIQQKGQEITDILGDESKNVVERGVGATAKGFSAISSTVYNALPDEARSLLDKVGGGIGKGFNYLTDKISNSKFLQEAMSGRPEDTEKLTSALKIASDLGLIAGEITLVDQGAKLAQKGVNKGLDVGGKIVGKSGELLKQGGKNVYKSAYNLTKQEAQLAQTNRIKIRFLEQELKQAPKGSVEANSLIKQIAEVKKATPTLRADTAFQKGIVGTEKQIGVQSGVERMNLWKNKIEPALRGSKDTISKEKLFSKAEQRILKEAEPMRQQALQDALDSVKEAYAKKSNIPILEANQIKTSLDKFTPSKLFKGQDIANELKIIKADMADAIREATYTSLKDVQIKTAYRDYANLKQLEEVGIKALTEAGTKGGFGNFWTTVYDALLTPVKTIGGKVLYKVGDKLEFVGRKGLRTFGQHAADVGLKIIP